jgi:hypothetical protein
MKDIMTPHHASVNRALTVAVLAIYILVLTFVLHELQFWELALDSSASPAAFEALDALFVLIAFFKLDNLFDMVRDSCNPLLYFLLR